MYAGSLHGQGWAQVATWPALWRLAPMVTGWLRIVRSEIG
jgi:ABC-2 type transport system permease protein